MKRKVKTMKKIIVVLALVLFAAGAIAQQADVVLADNISIDPLGNQWVRADVGAGEANYWIDQLGAIAMGKMDGPATIQYTLDHYYTMAPEGVAYRWGNGWLSKFVANLLAVRGYELREQLTTEQNGQLNDVLTDAVRDDTFRLDTMCGVDWWNGCSEDFVSFLALIARVKNFYPEVVTRVGVDELNRLEQKYLFLTFSTVNGYYSLRYDTTEDGPHVVMRNHGVHNAVYSGLLLIYLNHALESYSRVGNPVPNYYKNPTILFAVADMFRWLQSVSTSDGLSYLVACRKVGGGVVSCSDQYTANAIPQIVPAGRLIANLFGDSLNVFPEGKYQYRVFDTTYTGGNIQNCGRQSDYNLDNKEFQIKWTPNIVRRHLGRG